MVGYPNVVSSQHYHPRERSVYRLPIAGVCRRGGGLAIAFSLRWQVEEPHTMNDRKPSRRDLLRGVTAAGALSLGGITLSPSSAAARAAGDVIRAENAKPGTRDWMLVENRHRPGDEVSLPLDRGLCLARQRAGRRDDSAFTVSTNPASTVHGRRLPARLLRRRRRAARAESWSFRRHDPARSAGGSTSGCAIASGRPRPS